MPNIKIAVLGAGNIGGSIGRAWVAAGQDVAFGVNDLNGKNANALRAKLGDKANIGTLADALATNPDVVLLAIPSRLVDETLARFKDQLDGKIIIDATNKFGAPEMNSFASLQQHTPQAKIYRTFNYVGWENFENPNFPGGPGDLFYCGTEGDAKAVVEELISNVGYQPLYLGGVDQIGLMEAITQVTMALAFKLGKGREISYKLLTR